MDLYVPKLKRHKENFKDVKAYSEEIISTIVYYYLTTDLSFIDIEEKVFNNNYKGYRTLKILQYFGLRNVHGNIFADITKDKIIDILSGYTKIDYQFNDLYEIILKVKSESIVISNEEDKSLDFDYLSVKLEYEKQYGEKPDLLDSELEAYFNIQAKVRNSKIQNLFRFNLLKEFNHKCALCNINKKELLIASHIVPYSRCQNNIKWAGDYENGLLLCPNHDMLFEMGNFITFNSDGEIVISNKIDIKLYNCLGITKGLKLNERYLTLKRKRYLKIHKMFFNQNNQ